MLSKHNTNTHTTDSHDLLFIKEANKSTNKISGLIMELSSKTNSKIIIDELSTEIHALKGSCTFIENDYGVSEVCQYLEDILRIKSASHLNNDTIELLVNGNDLMIQIIKHIEYSEPVSEEISKKMAQLLSTSLEYTYSKNANLVNSKNVHCNNQSDLEKLLYSNNNSGVFISYKKIDELMSLASELVSFKNSFKRLTLCQNLDQDIQQIIEDLNKDINKVSELTLKNVTEIRNVHLDEIFRPLEDFVATLNVNSEKIIKITCHSNNIQVDKNIAMVLTQSLIHIIRNAYDHGIESMQERLNEQKHPEGKLDINAHTHLDHIIITIEDDGRGIDPEKIVSKAITLGLIEEKDKDTMSSENIFDLLMTPEFSSKDTNNEINSKDLTLHEVKENIITLEGKIKIASQLNIGTKFEITIPLPKSVIIERSIIVESNNILYAIPIHNIRELHRIEKRNLNFIQSEWTYLYRNQNVPISSFVNFIKYGKDSNRENTYQEDEMVIIIEEGNHKLGLRIDKVVDQMEAVIRPFGKLLDNVRGLQGSFILPNDKLAYVISTSNLIQKVKSSIPS